MAAPSSATSVAAHQRGPLPGLAALVADRPEQLLHRAVLRPASQRRGKHRHGSLALRRRATLQLQQPLEHGLLAAAETAQRGVERDRIVAAAVEQGHHGAIARLAGHHAE